MSLSPSAIITLGSNSAAKEKDKKPQSVCTEMRNKGNNQRSAAVMNRGRQAAY